VPWRAVPAWHEPAEKALTGVDQQLHTDHNIVRRDRGERSDLRCAAIRTGLAMQLQVCSGGDVALPLHSARFCRTMLPSRQQASATAPIVRVDTATARSSGRLPRRPAPRREIGSTISSSSPCSITFTPRRAHPGRARGGSRESTARTPYWRIFDAPPRYFGVATVFGTRGKMIPAAPPAGYRKRRSCGEVRCVLNVKRGRARDAALSATRISGQTASGDRSMLAGDHDASKPIAPCEFLRLVRRIERGCQSMPDS